MKIGVKILPRSEVLDSQGRAVEKTLAHHEKQVDSVRVGKYVQLEFHDLKQDQALVRAREIAEFVLVNPLIESYVLEVVTEESGA